MAELGAKPQVSGLHRRALSALGTLFTPLLPDDYLELINPLWSTRELKGKVEAIRKETDDTVTIEIRPGFRWPGHAPGQYLRVGVVIDGRVHWRAYSLTSDPDDKHISITPKLVKEGTVSPFFNEKLEKGTILRLGGVEGSFKLPDPLPEKLLFISAGSGITPVMSMLRHLQSDGRLEDVVHLHSSRTEDEVVFKDLLQEMHDGEDGFKLHLQLTKENGHLEPDHLDDLVPDWKEREAFVCGPAEMLDAMEARWNEQGDCDKLHMERFQDVTAGATEQGEGGTVKFLKSDVEIEVDGGTPILDAGENEGLELAYGCRMGVCHTCVGTLCSGTLRDMRNGEVYGDAGESVRICISAAEGDVEIDL